MIVSDICAPSPSSRSLLFLSNTEIKCIFTECGVTDESVGVDDRGCIIEWVAISARSCGFLLSGGVDRHERCVSA